MKPQRKRVMSLSEECVSALRNVAETVFPHRISLKDITRHARGYNREVAIEQLIEKAKESPDMTKLKLYIIYTELKKVADNGGLL